MGAALKFDRVSCRLDGREAVSALSFTLSKGETFCLLGPSGCGKSTSLRLVAGLEQPQAGHIFIDGEQVSAPRFLVPPEDRNIGFLFQEFALFPHLTIFENICFGIKHKPKSAQRRIAEDLLARIGLVDFAARYPHSLSGGEQQRVALARALAPSPKLILMDEPFSNLDPQLRNHMRDLCRDILTTLSATALIVTHDADDALRLADKIGVLDRGMLLQMDTPEILYRAPKNKQVALMFGALNCVTIEVKNRVAHTPFGALATDKADGRYEFAVRPEHIRLAQTNMPEDIIIEGDLQIIRCIGADWLCKLHIGDELIWTVLVRQDNMPQAGIQKMYIAPGTYMLFDM